MCRCAKVYAVSSPVCVYRATTTVKIVNRGKKKMETTTNWKYPSGCPFVSAPQIHPSFTLTFCSSRNLTYACDFVGLQLGQGLVGVVYLCSTWCLLDLAGTRNSKMVLSQLEPWYWLWLVCVWVPLRGISCVFCTASLFMLPLVPAGEHKLHMLAQGSKTTKTEAA
jgi:hypothetical protein